MSRVRCLLAAIRCEKGDVAANLAAHLDLVAQAGAHGCQLALFPEMSLTGSAEPATHPDRLIPLTHPAVAELAEASGATGTGVCFGIAERAGGGPYITQVFAAAGARLVLFPAWPRWSARTATSRPGCPTAARARSPSTSRPDHGPGIRPLGRPWRLTGPVVSLNK